MLAEGSPPAAAGAARTSTATRSTAAARPARRAARRDHLGRRDPRHRRLHVVLEPQGQTRRHRRTRTSRSRAWRATSSSSATPRGGSCASSAGRCASRTRRARRRRSRSGSARRRRAPRSSRVGLAPARGRSRRDSPDRRGRRSITWLASEVGARPGGRGADRRLPRRRAGGARRAADAGDARARALLRRSGRHAARHPRAVRQPHQPRLGARAAQALLPQVQLRAAGGGDRGRASCCRSDQRTASRSTRSSRTCSSNDACGRCSCRRCSTRRCSRRAGAGTRRVALALLRFRGGRKRPAALQRMDAEDLLAVVFPDQVACRENIAGRPRDPRPSAGARRRSTTACTRRWTSTASSALLGATRARRDSRRRARAHRAVAACRGDPHRAAVRVPRRRAARGAPHAGGDGAPLARPRDRGRSRRARRRGDRGGARRGVAGCARTPDELHDALGPAGFPRRGRARAELAPVRRRARGRPARHAIRTRGSGSPRSGCPSSRRCARGADRTPALEPPAEYGCRVGRARTRSSSSCAADCRVPGPGDGGGARAPLGVAPPRSRRRSRGSRPRARCCAAASRPSAAEDRVVRAAPARAHPPLHARPAARARSSRCEARDFLRFLFAGSASRPRPGSKGRTRSPRRSRSSRASRRRRRRGRPRSCPRASTSTSLPGSTSCASPAASSGRVSPRRGRRGDRAPAPVRTTPIALARRAATSPLWTAARRDGRRRDRRRRAGTRSPTSSARTAPRSSTRSSSGTGLLRTQVEDALGELVALGLVTATASRACARCSSPPTDAGRWAARRAAGARALFGHRGRRAAGRWCGGTRRRRRRARPKSSSTSRARCCKRYGVVFWRARSSAKRRGCRRGAICCASYAGSKRAARSAAGASSRLRRASSSRCPKPSGLLRDVRREERERRARVA